MFYGILFYAHKNRIYTAIKIEINNFNLIKINSFASSKDTF